MNKTQRLFEISLRPTETSLAALAEPQLGLRTDVHVQPHIEAIGELINSLLAQLDLLQYEPKYSDDVPCMNLREEVRRFEINLIQSALTRTRGSQVEAARFLGMKATTLHAKIKRYRVRCPYLIHLAPSQLDENILSQRRKGAKKTL